MKVAGYLKLFWVMMRCHNLETVDYIGMNGLPDWWMS